MSHDNSEALDRAFSVFYKFAMSFQSVLQRSELLAATSEIREQLCHLYTDLIALVVNVAIKFYKTVNGNDPPQPVGLTIADTFRHDFGIRQSGYLRAVWRDH